MRFSTFATPLAASLAIMSPVGAVDKGWSTTGEFGLVVTGGNSESQTIALNGTSIKEMCKSRLELKAGASTPKPPPRVARPSGQP